jgi:hypothetical protein
MDSTEMITQTKPDKKEQRPKACRHLYTVVKEGPQTGFIRNFYSECGDPDCKAVVREWTVDERRI